MTSTPMPARVNGSEQCGRGEYVARTGAHDDDFGTQLANPLDRGRAQIVGLALVEVRCMHTLTEQHRSRERGPLHGHETGAVRGYSLSTRGSGI